MTVHPLPITEVSMTQNKSQEDSIQSTQISGESPSETSVSVPDDVLDEPLSKLKISQIENLEATEEDFDENGDPIFPHDLLSRLDEMVNKPKWIIPVLPKAELELLMDATILLAKKGN